MELSLDTVGLQSSVAVSEAGRPIVEITWMTGRRHTPSLVPTIDEAVRRAGIERGELQAVFVDTGPGAYGGIRAGMAAAAGIALALGLPALGVGRLEIEAYAQAAAGRVAALHSAGREEWALARYAGPAEEWRETAAPRLCALEEALAALRSEPGEVVCGDLAALPSEAMPVLREAGWTAAAAAASMRRAGLLAELGWRALLRAREAGAEPQPAGLEPIYLRAPAIGPQPPAAGPVPAGGETVESEGARR